MHLLVFGSTLVLVQKRDSPWCVSISFGQLTTSRARRVWLLPVPVPVHTVIGKGLVEIPPAEGSGTTPRHAPRGFLTRHGLLSSAVVFIYDKFWCPDNSGPLFVPQNRGEIKKISDFAFISHQIWHEGRRFRRGPGVWIPGSQRFASYRSSCDDMTDPRRPEFESRRRIFFYIFRLYFLLHGFACTHLCSPDHG